MAYHQEISWKNSNTTEKNQMSHSMQNQNFVFTPMDHFSRKLELVKKSDRPGYNRIQKVIARLLVDPANGDGKMRGLYNGRFKKYVGRRDYRLIYYWCRLCRKENKRLEQKCDGCDTLPDNSVIFFDLYHKGDLKKLKEL